MKLILCLNCQDVIKLDLLKTRYCRCGKSRGRYRDNLNAVYAGESAYPLGISNGSLAEAIVKQPKAGLGERFEAFVIPKVCPTMQKVKRVT